MSTCLRITEYVHICSTIYARLLGLFSFCVDIISHSLLVKICSFSRYVYSLWSNSVYINIYMVISFVLRSCPVFRYVPLPLLTQLHLYI